MTIKKLLTFVAALLVGGATLWAQASFNHDYKDGVIPAAGGDYFLYNIGAKMFLTDGMDFGTHASVDHAGRVITLATATNGYSIFSQPYSANGTDAKAGYLTLNGYVDTGSNDADWVFTSVNVDGYTNAYTIKHSDTQYLYYEVKDGLYDSKMGAFISVGASTGDANSYWLLIPRSVREAVNDYTYLLRNTDMCHPWELPMWNKTNVDVCKGSKENVTAEAWHAVIDFSQTISVSIPNGKYTLHCQGFYYDTSTPTILYANSNETGLMSWVSDDCTAATSGTKFLTGAYADNAVTTVVTDNTLTVGVKDETGGNWEIFDNFYLEYFGTCLVNDAVALPASGAMTADTWYYYDLPSADDYDFTSSAAATLTYTTDGTQLTSGATGTDVTFTADETKTISSLPAGRLYFKTDAATTLTVSYKYNVGSATADASYIQTGNTVTVSYESLGTNNPSASVAKDFSGVTFDDVSISVTPTANGFTFTVPTVVANTAHTLYIPANAIGYSEGSTYNAAQDIVFNTPAVFDGTYFLKAAATWNGTSEGTSAAVDKYLARGTAHSTHTSLDSYGLAVVITTDGSNVSTLKMADTQGYIFAPTNSTFDSYADGASTEKIDFTISISNGKYLISNNYRSEGGTTKYLKYNDAHATYEEIPVYDDGTGANAGPIILWAVESISEHAAAMQAKKNAQAATAAAAAYASGNYASLSGISTVSALESELTTNYIEGAFVPASTITSVSESYQPRTGDGYSNMDPVTVYSNTIDITQAGFYKFSMQAFNRATWNENVQALHTAGADMPDAVLFFGDSETQIKSLYDETGNATEMVAGNDALYNGQYYANNTTSALQMFQDDKYHNDVWFYCSTPGTYTYGVKVMGFAAGQWFIYSPESVTITSYAAAATSADYTALTSAIATYDGATWGFESGEYAPYENIEAIEHIAAARAIDSEGTNSKLLVNSLTDYLTLTANTTEVNGFRWSISDFSAQGETTTDAGGFNFSNARISHNSGTNGGLLKLTNAMCLHVQESGTGTYGATSGYTLPLKGSTVYALTFAYAGWGATSGTPSVTVKNAGGTTIATESLATTSVLGNSTDSAWPMATVKFTTGEAGNYTIVFGATTNRVAYGDISLLKAETVNVTMAANAGKFGTFIAPFAVAIPSGIEAYTVTGYADSKLTLAAVETTIAANTPVLVKNTTGSDYSNVFSGQSLATADSYTTGLLTGVYTAATVPTDSYVLQTNGSTQAFYKVDAAFTATAYKCYLTLPAVGAKPRVITFDTDATAIRSIYAEGAANGAIYNLQGQQLGGLQRGVNIVNGKKVLVK